MGACHAMQSRDSVSVKPAPSSLTRTRHAPRTVAPANSATGIPPALNGDVMITRVMTVGEFSACNPHAFMNGKKTVFPGIGPDTLAKFHTRAKLLSTKDAAPVLRAPVQFPGYDRELFFDIEVDPMRDICYLHGFVERDGRDNATEKFVAFFAAECTPESERAAFGDAWNYMRSKRPCRIYYYSKYERTIYRKLQEKYPDVCSAGEVEELFDPAHAIDLYYDVVKKATEWPTCPLRAPRHGPLWPRRGRMLCQ